MMSILLKDKVLFFDDACILCNKSIRLIHFLDIRKTLFFSPLQSPLGIEIQQKSNLKELDSTVIYFRKGNLHTQSTAIIYCLSDSFWLFKPILIFLAIPTFIRNGIYNFIAKNRKRIFKNQTCSLPSESLRKQIIDMRL
jgi:predicted DCC family thiol-disulfide oxidoreductase YuxK